jgi:hypothetical protein
VSALLPTRLSIVVDSAVDPRVTPTGVRRHRSQMFGRCYEIKATNADSHNDRSDGPRRSLILSLLDYLVPSGLVSSIHIGRIESDRNGHDVRGSGSCIDMMAGRFEDWAKGEGSRPTTSKDLYVQRPRVRAALSRQL